MLNTNQAGLRRGRQVVPLYLKSDFFALRSQAAAAPKHGVLKILGGINVFCTMETYSGFACMIRRWRAVDAWPTMHWKPVMNENRLVPLDKLDHVVRMIDANQLAMAQA